MMKRLALIILLGLTTVACSSPGEEKRAYFESAEMCNKMCKDNPHIAELSQMAGGGMPLLFMGGAAIKCRCKQNQ